MHIKVERFLTLTALLASTQVALVGCGDDGNEPEATGGDAGRTEPSESTTSESTDESSSSRSGSEGNTENTAETLPTSDGGDTGRVTPVDAGDAGGLTADASDATAPGMDASSETPWTDAGGESTWGDASAEVWTDAGGEGCLAGDFADEVDSVACYATFGACEFPYAQGTCNSIMTEYRAGVASAFWDCYNDSNVADPCSEDAEFAANTCYSFAVEYAPLCEQTTPECADIVENCSEVTLQSCEAIFAPYNSGRRAQSAYCFDFRLSQQAGPNYEGCGYDFSNCVYSPAVE